MLIGINHLVVLVRDLKDATAAYEALGFTVTPGGEHPMLGTHNALIPFADDSYIELLAFKRERPDDLWCMQLSDGYSGLMDFALVSDDLDRDVAISALLRPFSIMDGGRETPDGREIAWRLGLPQGWRTKPPLGSRSVPLPFLIQDVTPRSLRVPQGTARQHRNGVAAVDRVYVGVDELDVAGVAYNALFGVSMPSVFRDALFGVDALSLPCGKASIVLVQLDAIAVRLPENLLNRGPGIIAVELNAKGGSAGRWLDIDQTMGAMVHIK